MAARPCKFPFVRCPAQVAGEGNDSVAASFVVAAPTLGFGLLAGGVPLAVTAGFDPAALTAFRSRSDPPNPIGPPWLGELARDMAALGSFGFLGFGFAAVVGYLLLARAAAILTVAAALGGAVIGILLKPTFDRPRPHIRSSVRISAASFPSGHAAMSTIMFLTLAALPTRTRPDRWTMVHVMGTAVLPTLPVGPGRLYPGVRYPTDVPAG